MKEPSLRKTIVEEVLGFVGVSVAEVRPFCRDFRDT